MSQTATPETATTTKELEPTHKKIKSVEITVKSPVKVKQIPVNTEDKVREYFKDIPILAEVARCESTFKQFDNNGNLIRGIVNNSDVGVMQINEYYHLETATKKGFDLHTLEGNMAYGRDLYNREGLRPWNPSSPCWGDHAGIAHR